MTVRAAFIAASLAASVAVAAPAQAAETVTVPFDTVSTGTTGTYSGVVRLTVSGIGNSNDKQLNDAFYYVPSGSAPTDYYQFGFNTSPLQPFTPSNSVGSRAIGGRPAYNASHVYSFLLDLGTGTPTNVYFGVTDGNYRDNGGAFEVSISAVPEPATWGMMIVGFGAAGFGVRRQIRRSNAKFDAKVKRIAAGAAA